MRRVARVLWALHVILLEVHFQTSSFNMSTASYPAGGLLPRILLLHVHSMAGLVQLAINSTSAICAACLYAYRGDPTSGIELASELHGVCPHPDCCRISSLASHMMLRKSEIPLGQSQGFDEEVGMILKQIYPPTMMMDLEASSQEAIMELAKAFPYQPAAGAAGLTRFQRVCHACHAQTAFIA